MPRNKSETSPFPTSFPLPGEPIVPDAPERWHKRAFLDAATAVFRVEPGTPRALAKQAYQEFKTTFSREEDRAYMAWRGCHEVYCGLCVFYANWWDNLEGESTSA